MAKGERIEQFLEGRIAKIKGIDYYKVLVPLDSVRKRNADCVRRNINAWKDRRIITRHNELFFIPLDNVAVIDIESTGLSYDDPMFLIGVGRYDARRSAFVYEGFFARDYYEEQTVLEAFIKRMSSAKAAVSFNGTFDMTRISARARNFFIEWGWPGEKHLDVMQALKPYKKSHGLEEMSLVAYEVALLGFTRPDDDVAGEKILAEYENYRKGGNPEPLARIVRHNVLDIFSTAALYVKLLRNPEYFNQSLLDKLSL
ncbi:ribonuclease H-like domain-containing protein [Candidatus Woesearchaeota archaeon]|nr:ribonuclease H-like domain-containing protein [Candidatus Woesearchaeota archaeon]MBW3005546.1 ribonuclease H-like domain-containing protein [Candidatus Woesearchaeota archaeon]